MMIKLSLLLISIILLSCKVESLHPEYDFSQHVDGRIMKVSKCFHTIPDKTTTFQFGKDDVFTMNGCNKYVAYFHIHKKNIDFYHFHQVTHKDCKKSHDEGIVKEIKSAKKFILLANFISFTDAKGVITIQMMDDPSIKKKK